MGVGAFLLSWIPALLLVMICGCSGGGGLSLTGGSVPIGKQQVVLTGGVVDEQNSTTAVPDASVVIASAQQEFFRGRTDRNGRFTTQVPEEDEYTVTIEPSAGQAQDFRSRSSQVRVDRDEVDVLVPLPRRGSPEEPMVTSLTIMPDTITLPVGGQVLFVLTAPEMLTGRPVWSVHGGLGDIDATGLFTARRAGTGRIRARIGGMRAEASVTVLAGP